VLATWAPATAMLPLHIVRHLVVYSKLRYRCFCPLLCRCCCHRDDARCRCDDALGLPWCRSTRSCVQLRKAVELSNLRRIAHVAVIATIKPGKRQAKNPRTASPLTSLITAAFSPSRRARLQGIKFLYGAGCQIRRQAGHGAAHSSATYLGAAEYIPRLAAVKAHFF
jgi:hypothetical protein